MYVGQGDLTNLNLGAIKHQMEILVQIVRAIQLKRALASIDTNPGLNFWRLIYGGLLDLAVLEWCKIFGVDSEDTHWKMIVVQREDQDKFRQDMLMTIGVTRGQWDENWEKLTTYRNEGVAHYCPGEDMTHFPELSLALRSSIYYHNYLSSLIGEDDADSIEEYAVRFYRQAEQMAAQAINATNIFTEKVF